MIPTAPTRQPTEPPADAPHATAGHVAEDPTGAMFASSSVPLHLLRGALGLVLLVGSLVLAGDHPWALLGLVGTLLAWRGCPTCWAMGLVATRARCAEGGCARR